MDEDSIRMSKILLVGLVSIFIAGSLMGGCAYLNQKMKVEDDHLGEEMLEMFLEEQTGWDLDFTPGSKEEVT